MGKQEKTEGKAAVDLLASYFGKSGASFLTQVGYGSIVQQPYCIVQYCVVLPRLSEGACLGDLVSGPW